MMENEDYKLRLECAAELVHELISESNKKNEIISGLRVEIRELKEQLAAINSLQSENKSGIIQEERFNPNHDEKGRFASGSRTSGTKYAPSPRRNSVGITVKPKTYAMLCGEFNTKYPGSKEGFQGVIFKGSYQYFATSDGNGGIVLNRKIKLR